VHPGARAPAHRRPTAAIAITSALLIVGIALRVLLALVNLEANDPHLPVIRAIAFEHRFPTREQEWEGFQPKLYHATAAFVWRLLPTRDPYALTRAAQLVSCVAGVLTLLVVLRFLRLLGAMREGTGCAEPERGLPLSGAIAFAAVALNPALVGTSVQATNDSFVILFASLTLYSGARVLADGRGRDFAALVLWATLAGISKGNGLAVIVAVAATFAIVCLVGPGAERRRRAAIRGAVFVALVAAPVALIGPYYSHQRQHGTPFVTNWNPSRRPHLLYETFVSRPGLTSVLQGLLTFRLVDLFRHPESNDDWTQYPRHRTSLWSRVYAQAHSSHFESWPPSWKARSQLVLQLTRALLLLGLVPTALVAWGFAAMARDAALGWRHACRRRFGAGDDDDLARRWPATLLLLVAAAGYLTFAAIYSIRLRDYSSMKAIFILPALPAFAAALELGGVRLLAWRVAEAPAASRGPRRTTVRAIALALALLLAGYVADLGVLAAQLAEDRAAGVLPAD
jgi:Dolichyl-phosphate-mannose-protein mannosyltransferase